MDNLTTLVALRGDMAGFQSCSVNVIRYIKVGF
jgi:hypothetical protein